MLKGGTLYRDIVEPNLPGVVWVHLGLRSLVGWSSEAIRVADLTLFGITVFLLSQLISGSGRNQQGASRPWAFAACCVLFYITRNEWCHCQRDVWMLLPVSAAMCIRLRSEPVRSSFSTLAEGVFWGTAFWIKPHVAIPALAVIIADSVFVSGWRNRMQHVLFIVVGGLIAAAPGIVWLVATGAWEHFLEMMLEWNPEYLATGKERRTWDRVGFMLMRFYPWWLVHVVAVPTAVATLWRLSQAASSDQSRNAVVLSVLYLAWLCQTFLLQHALDYIHVPEILLAICVLAVYPWQVIMPIRRFAVVAMLFLGILAAPQFQQGRITVWLRCLQEGSTPEIRGTLAQGNYPNWQDIDRVRRFLADQGVRDGDVACLNVHSVHLHKELHVQPATRYWSINCLLTMYPSRYEQIMNAVYDSDPRYIVNELQETTQPQQVLPEGLLEPRPVVFEAGTYRVHRVSP